MSLRYKRIMLKFSGEMLQGHGEHDIDFEVLRDLCSQVVEVHKAGCEIAVVVGGGNFWRYRDAKESGLDRVVSDSMGMMGTIMNAVAMQNCIEDMGVESRVCSALNIPQLGEIYLRRKALRHLEKKRIVLCAGGTGHPFFTTDSAAALRGLELSCDVLLKATKVDGVYDADPEKVSTAKRYESLTFSEALARGLQFMDATAISLCREGVLPIIVFSLKEKGNILRVVRGEQVGTQISGE